MKREQGEAKPHESPVHDVARDEQLKVHMEKWNETMLKSIQNTSFTNATLPMPNPALMMQFAMMQMPLASLFQNQGISGKGTVAETKHDDTDDTTNNTAHDLTHSRIGRGDTNSSLPEITPLVSDLERSYSRDSRQYGAAKRAHSLPGSLPEKIGVPASQDLSMYGELDDEAYEGLDEKDIKRLKRKQSNRESARRSRLRKQAECESLQSENAALKVENERLRQEIFELREMLVSLQKRTQ